MTQLEKDAEELQRGITEQNPSIVKHAANDSAYCHFGNNWLCSRCPYKERCDNMRREAGEFVWEIRKATSKN